MAAPDDTARNKADSSKADSGKTDPGKTDSGKTGAGRTDAREATTPPGWGSLPPLADGVSYAEGLYAALKQGVSDGRLSAGTRLRETELAEYFGVSRTPVREALKKLQSEGLLVDLPGRGLTVQEPSLQEILDAYLVREALEGLAARLAAERALDADLVTLESLLRQIRAALETGSDDRAVTLSQTFDEALFGASKSDRLMRLIVTARTSQGTFLRANLASRDRLLQSTEERVEILQALRKRDPEAAENATRNHLRRAREIRIAANLEGNVTR